MEQEEKSHQIKHLIREGKTNAQARKVKKYNEKSDESAHVDLAPMVDIAFLLLTFFMLTTSFSRPNVLTMRLPEQDTAASGPSNNPVFIGNLCNILLAGNGDIWIEEGVGTDAKDAKFAAPVKVPAEEFRKKMAERIQRVPATVAVVKVDREAEYYKMVDAIDEIGRGAKDAFIAAGVGNAEERRFQFAMGVMTEADRKKISGTGSPQPTVTPGGGK